MRGSTPSKITVGKSDSLRHGGQQEAHGPRLLRQLAHHVIPVDIVHPCGGVSFQIVVQEGLEGAHGQLGGGVGDGVVLLMALRTLR